MLIEIVFCLWYACHSVKSRYIIEAARLIDVSSGRPFTNTHELPISWSWKITEEAVELTPLCSHAEINC